MKPGLKYGLAAGLAAILFSLALYFTDKSLLFTSVLNLVVPLLIFFAAGVLSSAERRRKQGGVLMYDQAMASSLGAFIVGMLIWTVFLLALMLMLDPDLLPMSKTIRLQALDAERATGKMEPGVYETNRKAIEEGGKQAVVFGYLITNLLYVLAGMILFLFSSVLLKRDRKNQ